MTSIWQKIALGIIFLSLAWVLTFFRLDSYTGTEGRESEDRQEQRIKDSEDRIIKKIDENDARIVKAIDELKETIRDHTH